MCFARSGRVPVSGVHVLVWGCVCSKGQGHFSPDQSRRNLQHQHRLPSSLVPGGFWTPLVVFALGLRPAVASSLRITTHSCSPSVQRAFLWVVKNSDVQERSPCHISNTHLQRTLPLTSSKTQVYCFIFATWVFLCVSSRHFVHSWLTLKSPCFQSES